jgi:hypothetical protein
MNIEKKLNDLAAQWRGANRRQEHETEAALIHQYHAVLHCLIELGHADFLDAESELPDRLMPAEYFEWIARLNLNMQSKAIQHRSSAHASTSKRRT